MPTTTREPGGFLRSWGVSGTSDETSIGNGVYRRTMPEMFLLRFMQIDPHWLNFFFGKHPETSEPRFTLLDFGGFRSYSTLSKLAEQIVPLVLLIRECIWSDMKAIRCGSDRCIQNNALTR
ncbi:hypothetical protein QR680_002971 [Steinernema hermaphroditum]|uniref:ABC1 atypical kinase-like domain-containing protein n=1 Tax=Steinernema hermaphroditum TaxID=289476 RepID=A0AA39H4V5_9BILA|nr:hypothetical protein QR680_002971 [Steinernema hermaphroditum]